MNNEHIKPLFEDPSASSELRNFVALARSDGASQADLDRLAKGLGPILGVSAGLIAAQASAFGSAPTGVSAGLAPTAGWAPAASAAKASLLGKLLASSSAKLVAVGLSVGVAGVGTWELQRAAQGGPGPRVPAAAAVSASPVTLPTLDRTSGAGANEAVTPEAEPVAEPEAPASARAIAPAAVIASAHPRVVRRSGVSAHTAVPTSGVSTQVPAQTEAAPAVQPAAPETVEPRPTAVVQPAVAPPSELSLIRRAQAAHADTNEALTLIAQHEQLYPHGALTQEREMLAIEVLLKAGRIGAAQGRAARFEASYPGSAHRPRLHALLQRAGADSK